MKPPVIANELIWCRAYEVTRDKNDKNEIITKNLNCVMFLGVKPRVSLRFNFLIVQLTSDKTAIRCVLIQEAF